MLTMHFFLDLFMCLSVLLACLYAYHVCTWCFQRSEEGVGSLRTQGQESRIVVSATVWALRTEPKSSERAGAHNH